LTVYPPLVNLLKLNVVAEVALSKNSTESTHTGNGFIVKRIDNHNNLNNSYYHNNPISL